jgi:hypothetical protein
MLPVAAGSAETSKLGGVSGGDDIFFKLNLKAASNGVAGGTKDTLLTAHLMCPSIVFCVKRRIKVRPAALLGTTFPYLMH